MSEDQELELSLPEIYEQHKDRWVAITVTKRDRNGQPVAGKVIAEDVDRYRLRQNIARYNEVCIFFAGETPFPLFL
jgi:hypothetical protein